MSSRSGEVPTSAMANWSDPVRLAASAWTSGELDSRALPEMATRLLVLGFDSASLRDLAGLDLAPFDPRDAGEIFEEAVNELGVSVTTEERQVMASAVLAHLLVTDRLTPRETTGRFALLAATEGYPDEPAEIMTMYALDDEWEWDEPRGSNEIANDVRVTAESLLRRLGLVEWQPDPVILAAMAK